MDSERPQVIFSACLGFERCRYNGEIVKDEFCEQLKNYVNPITVCPEVAIGLGVPRDPIRIIYHKDDFRLIQTTTGKDLTDSMRRFASEFLFKLSNVDGFVLKSRSPSCGPRDVKSYNEEGNLRPSLHRRGVFASAVIEKFPHRPVEDEGRLKNYLIRESFLTRVFSLHRFRLLRSTPTMGKLVDFHTTHKLLLMAYDPNSLHRCGRLVANAAHQPLNELLDEYESILSQTFARPPKYTNAINVLLHTLGYFSRKLTSAEKGFFLDLIESYRTGRLPLSAPVSVVRSWIIRFNEQYLARQYFFKPYPEDLQDISDSGKGRSH
ncbi:MAG: YbgA family protein [bacterium]